MPEPRWNAIMRAQDGFTGEQLVRLLHETVDLEYLGIKPGRASKLVREYLWKGAPVGRRFGPWMEERIGRHQLRKAYLADGGLPWAEEPPDYQPRSGPVRSMKYRHRRN